jgi:hypothetical protein
MSAAATCHRMLSAQLRTDPAFAFDFARRFRDIPPIEPDDIDPMLVVTLQPRKNADPKVDLVDVTALGRVRPEAQSLPNREPWPERWLLWMEIIEEAPPLQVLIDWPHRHALLRAQFRCPLTAFVVVPNFGLAKYINELFAIEPELTPVVVVSHGVYLPGAANGPLVN